MNGWLKKIEYHTCNRILFCLEKEGTPAICNNVAEPGGPYAKESMPDTGRQILYDLTCTWDLKKSDGWKQRKEQRLPGAGRWGEWRDVGQRV